MYSRAKQTHSLNFVLIRSLSNDAFRTHHTNTYMHPNFGANSPGGATFGTKLVNISTLSDDEKARTCFKLGATELTGPLILNDASFRVKHVFGNDGLECTLHRDGTTKPIK